MAQTDHSKDIASLRRDSLNPMHTEVMRLSMATAADLLEMHDATGISLDNWASARDLVEALIFHPISPNGA